MIALYRTDRGRFALDETGDWQPSIKTTLVIAKGDGASVAYLCGLLNSELLDLWYAVRGKTPWHVRRNYEPKPMARIPYRHLVPADETSSELDGLRAALAAQDGDAVFAAALALRDSAPEEIRATAIEVLVRAIADNRRALLPHRDLDPGLTRIVKDPWKAGPVTIDEGRMIDRLPAADLRSVRLDPDLTVSIETDGVLGRSSLSGQKLTFKHARKETATVTGPADRLALLQMVVGAKSQLLPDELESISLPKDLASFVDRVAEEAAAIYALLALGRSMVEAVERLVCNLYGVPPELEDAVVQAAVNRSGAVDEYDTGD